MNSQHITESAPRYKYLIHALFNKKITSKINSVQKQVTTKYKKYLFQPFTYDSAHMTII